MELILFSSLSLFEVCHSGFQTGFNRLIFSEQIDHNLKIYMYRYFYLFIFLHFTKSEHT